MPEALGLAELLDAGLLIGLVPLAVAAGLVRGFAGFGTALVFVPVAARVMEPAVVVVTLLVMDAFGPLALLRRALGDGDRREALRLSLGGVVGVPVGVWLLTVAEPVVFRWIASLLALGLLALVVAGVRFRARRGGGEAVGVGAVSGLLGGFSGLSAPPLVLFYLGGRDSPAVIRANVILFFMAMEVVGLATFAAHGLLAREAVALGLILAVPYTLAIVAGARIFAWRGDALFRTVAYVLVGAAALSGLPVFG